MELYTHTKLSTVERERLELLKNCNLIQVGFIPFNIQSSDPIKNSPLHFKRSSSRYFAKQQIKLDGFALSLAQPSGYLEQGALIAESWGLL